MPSYNASNYIAQSIESVLCQSYTNLELIVVDDASTDNTVEVIEGFVKADQRVRLIALPINSGAAGARNAAIRATTGTYIAFLDCDDLWNADKLATQIEFMEVIGCHFSFSAYDRIDEVGNFIDTVNVPASINHADMLKTSVIGCLTAIYDTRFFGRVEMPDIRKRQDFGLWLLLLKKGGPAFSVQRPLAKYRMRSGSISSGKMNAAYYTWRIYRDFEELDLLRSSYYFAHYAVKGLVRHKLPKVAKRLHWL
jgi:glycosyltransferase involved in cell wall biosynthesis